MTTSLMPEGRQRYYNNDGTVAAGAFLYTYAAGTSTPKAAYTDSAGLVPHANPIVLDAKGEAVIYFSGSYKIDLKTSAGVQITGYPVDNYSTIGSTLADDLANSTDTAKGSSLVGYKPPFTGSVGRTQSSKNSDFISVKDFGAVGNGVDNDRAAIQAAIDYAGGLTSGGTVFIPDGVYGLRQVTYPGSGAAGVSCLVLKDNVTLLGNSHAAKLFVLASDYGDGAFYRVITSLGNAAAETGLKNAGIENLTIDGNKANQITYTGNPQAANVLIEADSNVFVRNVKSINANGQAIMVRGKTTNAAENIIITDSVVLSANDIGIQASQWNGLRILNNYVETCTNNAIDIYGEDGDAVPNGRDFVINGNTVRGCLTGIFPETVKDGTVTGNAISGCTDGIHTNRINGAPGPIVISGNNIADCTGKALYHTGDNNMVFATGNIIRDCAVGVQLGNAGGNISYVVASDNIFDNVTSVFSVNAVNASFIKAFDNLVKDEGGFTTWYSKSITGAETNVLIEPRLAIDDGLNVKTLRNDDAASVSNVIVDAVFFNNSGQFLDEFVKVTYSSPVISGGNIQGGWKLSVKHANVYQDMISVIGNTMGFYGSAPIAKPTITGSRGGNAALASLLTNLASLGLIIDSTT